MARRRCRTGQAEAVRRRPPRHWAALPGGPLVRPVGAGGVFVPEDLTGNALPVSAGRLHGRSASATTLAWFMLPQHGEFSFFLGQEFQHDLSPGLVHALSRQQIPEVFYVCPSDEFVHHVALLSPRSFPLSWFRAIGAYKLKYIGNATAT